MRITSLSKVHVSSHSFLESKVGERENSRGQELAHLVKWTHYYPQDPDTTQKTSWWHWGSSMVGGVVLWSMFFLSKINNEKEKKKDKTNKKLCQGN